MRHFPIHSLQFNPTNGLAIKVGKDSVFSIMKRFFVENCIFLFVGGQQLLLILDKRLIIFDFVGAMFSTIFLKIVLTEVLKACSGWVRLVGQDGGEASAKSLPKDLIFIYLRL